jgi:hypothetical protein
MKSELEHYLALQRTERYLPISELEDGCLYLIHARNNHIGQWVAPDDGFVLLREKFGEHYLFTEYHWDRSANGTAKPLVKLSGPIPPAQLREVLAEKLRELPYVTFMERTRSFVS